MRHGRGVLALGVLMSVVTGPVQSASGTDRYTFVGTLGGSEGRQVVHPFDVGLPSTLTITLYRSDPKARMRFALRDPSGVVVARGDASELAGAPLAVPAGSVGRWRMKLAVPRGEVVSYELRVRLTPRNRPPEPADDVASARPGERVLIPVTANDRDPDGDALALVRVGSAGHGVVTIEDPSTVGYVPGRAHEGTDAFTYEICDDGSPTLCASATVRVEVASASQAIGSSPSPSPPAPSPSPTTTRPMSPLPLVKGLSTRWSYSRELGAYIQRVGWSELQPTPYGPIVHPNPIDEAIARGVPFRVRLLAGRYAPQWVLDLGSVTITDPFLGVNEKYTVPRWWTPAYADAYADLIAKLAAEYDGVVPAFSMSGPMTVSAEPFLHQLASAETRAAVLAAGWSTAAERTAFQRMIEAHAAFASTRTFMAINPGQTYDPSTGRWKLADVSYMRALTDHFVRTLGARAIVQNNSLNVTRATENEAYVSMYEYMKQLRASGVPIAFQTAQTALVEDLPWVLDYAVAAGAHLVELPANWQELDTPEHLALVDQRLRANEP